MELDRDYANLKCRVLSKMVNEQERDDKEKEKWMVKYMALMRTYKHDKKISNSYKMDAQSKIKSLLQFSQVYIYIYLYILDWGIWLFMLYRIY